MGIARSKGVQAYAKRDGKDIYIRGSAFASNWEANSFTATEALEIAAYLVTLANEANKPEFEPLGMYLDDDGDFFIRNEDNDGWTDATGEAYRDTFATRPLVRLVFASEVK